MNYRLYSFTNFYLSSIQHGIQTAHVVGELLKGPHASVKIWNAVHGWANNDKTIITLNGGANLELTELKAKINQQNQCLVLVSDSGAETTLPAAWFHEDERSMGGMLTSVGFIVPETIWGVTIPEGFNHYYDKLSDDSYTPGAPSYEFIHLLKTSRLAQ